MTTRYNRAVAGGLQVRTSALNLRFAKPEERGETAICSNSNGHLYKTPMDEKTIAYIWDLPSGAIGNSNSNSILVNFDSTATSGIISVSCKNSCGTGSPGYLPFSLTKKPSKPTIIKEGNEFISSSATGNQWYYENKMIPGATDQKQQSLGDGSYYVIVSDNGCSSSASDILISTDVKTLKIDQFYKIFPNPVTDYLFVQWKGEKEYYRYTINNMIGNTIQQGIIYNNSKINTAKLPSGIYLFRIEYEENMISKTFIKK